MNQFCPNCGTKVPEGATFCPNCGTKLTQAEPKTAEKTNAPKSNASRLYSVAEITKKTNEAKAANRPVQTVNGERSGKRPGKIKLTRWIVAVIIALLVIFIGYRQVYVPHMIASALNSNNLSTTQGYRDVVSPSKHTVVLVADNDLEQKYFQAMGKNEFDTRRINVEDQLSGLSHDLSSRLIGQWKVAICIKDSQSSKVGVLWEYNGNKETHRFQTSTAGKQLRQEYQARKAQAAEQAREEENGEKIGAGLVGGGLGFLLGSL